MTSDPTDEIKLGDITYLGHPEYRWVTRGTGVYHVTEDDVADLLDEIARLTAELAKHAPGECIPIVRRERGTPPNIFEDADDH